MDKLTRQYLDEWVDGDERAFQKVFDHYLPKLISFSFRSLKNVEDAEELSLNVMLNIWKYKGNISTIVDFEDYLFGILRNQIARHYRKKMLITEELDAVPLFNLGTVDHPEFSLKELQLKYQSALHKIPEKQREVFVLSREQGMSQKQIAKEKGLSIHTVNNHITSSLKLLRKEFQDYPEALSIVIAVGAAMISKS
jgi:RNA polymerase sigma-70 factor (family 1)